MATKPKSRQTPKTKVKRRAARRPKRAPVPDETRAPTALPGEPPGGDPGGDEEVSGDPPAATPSPAQVSDGKEAAASHIGHSIHAHLEALHMTDPDDAVAAIRAIVGVPDELAQIGQHLETLGAADLARDLRLEVDRMRRAR